MCSAKKRCHTNFGGKGWGFLRQVDRTADYPDGSLALAAGAAMPQVAQHPTPHASGGPEVDRESGDGGMKDAGRDEIKGGRDKGKGRAEVEQDRITGGYSGKDYVYRRPDNL